MWPARGLWEASVRRRGDWRGGAVVRDGRVGRRRVRRDSGAVRVAPPRGRVIGRVHVIHPRDDARGVRAGEVPELLKAAVEASTPPSRTSTPSAAAAETDVEAETDAEAEDDDEDEDASMDHDAARVHTHTYADVALAASRAAERAALREELADALAPREDPPASPAPFPSPSPSRGARRVGRDESSVRSGFDPATEGELLCWGLFLRHVAGLDPGSPSRERLVEYARVTKAVPRLMARVSPSLPLPSEDALGHVETPGGVARARGRVRGGEVHRRRGEGAPPPPPRVDPLAPSAIFAAADLAQSRAASAAALRARATRRGTLPRRPPRSPRRRACGSAIFGSAGRRAHSPPPPPPRCPRVVTRNSRLWNSPPPGGTAAAASTTPEN